VLNLQLADVGEYYLQPAGSALWQRQRLLIPFSSAGSDHLAQRFVTVTEAALLGILATSLSQGVTIGLGFWLVGLPNPLLWGAVTALVSVLPILGSSLVWVPATAVLLLSQRPGAALALGLIGAVVSSNVDNVIRPVIYRRVSGLHPMASLLGAFAGVEMFGLIGLVLGPLAIAYCLELISLYETEYGVG
jgi:predicted PurR-regulated permease PerM